MTRATAIATIRRCIETGLLVWLAACGFVSLLDQSSVISVALRFLLLVAGVHRESLWVLIHLDFSFPQNGFPQSGSSSVMCND